MDIKVKCSKIIAIANVILIYMMLFPFVKTSAEKNMYQYDKCNIMYTVKNEWENNQNVEITIKNTGNEPVYNWSLGFDAGGEIAGIWNGTIYDNNGTNYIIKNAGYNYEIQPDESVTFGYTLNNSDSMPDDFILCQERKAFA